MSLKTRLSFDLAQLSLTEDKQEVQYKQTKQT